MNNQVVKPEEFGLNQDNVKEIENAFLPKIKEREQYIKVYDHLLSKPLTEEVCKEAKALRLKLVKVRTGIASIHKSQKSYFWSAGKFVDAWKNKETEPLQQMEKKLSEVEKHFENIERERIQRLHDQRLTALKDFNPLSIPDNLGVMDDDTFNRLLDREKRNFEFEQEEKRKKEEEELKAKQKKELSISRREEALPYFDFWSDYENQLDFSDQSESDFNHFINRIKSEKEAKDKKDEELRRISEIRNSRISEISPYIHFVRDYESLLSMNEESYHKELNDVKRAAKEHFEFEEKEKKRIIEEKQKRELEAIDFLKSEGYANFEHGMKAINYTHVIGMDWYNNLSSDIELSRFKEDVLKDKQVELLRISEEKALKELDDKKREEQQKKIDEEKRAQHELSKNDSEKVSDLIDYLGAVKSNFYFESTNNREMFKDVCSSIDDILKRIK